MGPSTGIASATEQSDCRYRQQTGTYRMGGTVETDGLPTHTSSGDRIDVESVRITPSLLRREQDERTVKRRAGKPEAINGSQ